jgi:hypothetical protein
MDSGGMMDNIQINCCYDCIHCGYNAPQWDQPYAEFWCGKEHWDGFPGDDSLLIETNCKDFERKINEHKPYRSKP